MKQRENLRWGKVLTWGLLGVVVAAFVVLSLTLFPAWFFPHADGSPGPAPSPEPAARPHRSDDKTVVLPPDVLRSLDLRIAEAVPATGSRTLPPLTGCLAVDPNRMVRIHSRFAGEIVDLGQVDGRTLRNGDKVQANQVLAVVWSKDLGEKKSEMVDALARLRIDLGVLERLRALEREGATAERSVREAEKVVAGDRIAVVRAERTLRSWRLSEEEIKAVQAEAERIERKPSDTTGHESWARAEIRSPQAGVLLEKNIAVGDIVDTSADLFKVADLDTLIVWAHAYEEDLPTLQRLPTPIPWTIQLPAQPGVVHRGRVERINPVLDPNQHTALVSGPVDNRDGSLRAGQFVTATIDVKATGSEVEVPTAALVEDGRESVVFVQPSPGLPRFERRTVTVIRRFQDIVHLQAGSIRVGERVVIGGAVLLNEAMAELPLEP